MSTEPLEPEEPLAPVEYEGTVKVSELTFYGHPYAQAGDIITTQHGLKKLVVAD